MTGLLSSMINKIIIPLKKFSQNVEFYFALTTGRVGSTCSIWLTGFDFLREFNRKDFVHR